MKQWGAFAALAAIWGSSYLFIKIADRELAAFTLVTVRLALGATGLWIITALMRLPAPHDRRTLLHMAGLGLINTALPFVLITWGEKAVDSGVTSVLLASVPLFALLIAHFALHDERITWLRTVGLLVGFVGVIVIFGENLGQIGSSGVLGSATLVGQAAIMLASACYGAGGVMARKLTSQLHPIIASTYQVTGAFIFVLIGALATEWPLRLQMGGGTLFAVSWLGLLGTCTGYVIFFYLIHQWGATRTSLVTYVIPVVSVALGAIVLQEKTDWRLLAGFVLIVGGMALVNRKPPQITPAVVVESSDAK